MSEPEPSMEDILSSIKDILYDDSLPKPQASSDVEASKEKEADVSPKVNSDAGVVPEAFPEAEAGVVSDMVAEVAALSNMVDSAKSSEESDVLELTEDMMVDTAETKDKGLVSESAVDAAAGSLAELSKMQMLEQKPEKATFVGNGALTLEDMVRDALRPVLKEWLDANLPAIVEKLVKKEIQRVAEKADV